MIDREKVSDLLYKIYSIESSHLAVTGVIAKQYYCKALWRELFDDSEPFPIWMRSWGGEECRETLKDTQPERKTGYWHITDAYPHNVYCSECHKKYAQTHWTVWEDGSLPRNFCPNCGAYMKGEEEE